MRRIKLTESQFNRLVERCVNRILKEETEQKWRCIAFLQMGGDQEFIDEILEHQEDERYLCMLIDQFCNEDNDEPIETHPRIAQYDDVIFNNNNYLILYNTTVGGAMAIYEKV